MYQIFPQARFIVWKRALLDHVTEYSPTGDICISGTSLPTEANLGTLFKLLVFSVTKFKIEQNKDRNRLIGKVQNLGKEKRQI